MKNAFDVLVIGAGVVGLTAALGMAKRHFKVAVLDSGKLQVDSSKPDVRVYAINKASQSLLQDLGVWDCIEKNRLSPYRQMHVWDGVSQAVIDFDSREVAAQELGFIIEEVVLKQALLQCIARQSGIELFAEHYVEKVEQLAQGVQVQSRHGLFNARLLMVADGAQSPTREQLQVALTSWPYQQTALVATVKTEKPHLMTAYQVFNSDGPLAFLPLANPHQCSIVWSRDRDAFRDLSPLNEAELNAALATAFANKLGQTQIMQGPYHFPLFMRHANTYVGNHWLLLGDAAHTVHPLAGLGLNVGLADISSWLNHVDREKKLLSRKMLGAYQRERKHAVWQTILLMEGFKQLFANQSTPIVSLRGLGIKACNNSGLIKRLFVQHAAG